MKRVAFLYPLMFICLLGSLDSFGQQDARKACPFSITGIWRSEATSASTPIYFNFSPEGYVTLLGFSADALPQDFEIITAVNYKLDNSSRPKTIEFTTTRGNDVFPQGITILNIAEYSDDSFVTIDPASEQKTRWVREQTHRYFLTFAARKGTQQQGGLAFAMLTTLDGRQTKVEALGVQVVKDPAGKTLPMFGPIPAEIYEQMAEQSDEDKKIDKADKDEVVMMRFELTTAEFERTHKVFDVWGDYVKTHSLPQSDPYLNAIEFLKKSVEPLNQCTEKVKLDKLSRTVDGLAAKDNLRQQPLDFIKAMRKKNETLHVPDAFFPWGWRPMLQLPGQ